MAWMASIITCQARSSSSRRRSSFFGRLNLSSSAFKLSSSALHFQQFSFLKSIPWGRLRLSREPPGEELFGTVDRPSVAPSNCKPGTELSARWAEEQHLHVQGARFGCVAFRWRERKTARVLFARNDSRVHRC